MNINLTLLGQMIVFVIFVMFTKKYVWTPIINALAERRTKIAEGLAAAEKGQQAQALGEEQAQQVIAQAKSQAAEIISKAEKRHSEIVDGAKDDAKNEGDKILASARGEIDKELNMAKEELRGQVAALSVQGASKILAREVDASVHADMLDDLSAKL